MIRLLLAGAAADALDEFEESALHQAAANGHEVVVRMLATKFLSLSGDLISSYFVRGCMDGGLYERL